MRLLTINQQQHQRFARLRRRIWMMIGLCMVLHMGDAALQAQQADQQRTQFESTRDCAAKSAERTNFNTKNKFSGSKT